MQLGRENHIRTEHSQTAIADPHARPVCAVRRPLCHILASGGLTSLTTPTTCENPGGGGGGGFGYRVCLYPTNPEARRVLSGARSLAAGFAEGGSSPAHPPGAPSLAPPCSPPQSIQTDDMLLACTATCLQQRMGSHVLSNLRLVQVAATEQPGRCVS